MLRVMAKHTCPAHNVRYEYFEGCYCCEDERREAARAKHAAANQEAAFKAELKGLPPITAGTPRQIAWAITIRDTAIEKSASLKELVQSGAPFMADARWWIDKRTSTWSKVAQELGGRSDDDIREEQIDALYSAGRK